MNEKKFIESLKKINIIPTEKELKQLNDYYEMLIEWNEKINLTAITKKEDVYLKHFYDSLTLTEVIDLQNENSLCDVGTGAGFPGIVLKIFFPHLKLVLVDALNKRLEFLKLVCENLGLDNVFFIHERAEDFSKKTREEYDVVTARAVAKLNILLEYCVPLVKVGKYFVALKGKESELDLCDNVINKLSLEVEETKKINLPYENSDRTIIKFKKTKQTNKKYPRKFNEIKNKPL